MGLAEAITLKCNAEREKYLSVYDVIEIINSDDIDLVIHIMDSSGLFSLTVYELNNLDPYNPIYKPVCNSYELKQKVRDYIKARRQFIHEDNNFDENMTLQRCLKKNLWSRFDLLKIEDIVKNTRLIVRGDSNAIYSMYSDMINRRDSEYYELPESTQQAIKDYMNLGSHQRELLIPLDDSQDVESKQVQRWLKHNGLLYQKSDSNSLEKPMEVYNMRKRIAELEQEASDAKATGSFSMVTPAVRHGKPKTNEQLTKELAAAEAEIIRLKAKLTDKPADEIELNPKTQTAVTCLLNVLFHKAEMDITAHKGTTNKNIVNLSKSLNAKITEKPVSHWIKQVQQLRIDTQKKDN